MLAPVFIGYFLSIYWGYLIVRKALSDSVDFQTFLENANAKSDAPPSAGINIGGGSQPGNISSGGFGFGNNSGIVGRR